MTNAKLFVFTVSAVLAGLAGALYVPQVGIINPSEFSPGNSIEIAIWVSVGGRGTLVGAIIGAVLVNLAKTWLTGAAPEIWLFVLGGLFVLATLVFPRGIVGLCAPAPGRPGRTPPAALAGRRSRHDRRRAPRQPTRCSTSTASRVSFDGFKALERAVAGRRARASCARSSAPTAPARRR